jgi:hypothetical protein
MTIECSAMDRFAIVSAAAFAPAKCETSAMSFLDRIRAWWSKDDVERADEETRMTPEQREYAEEDYQAQRDDVHVAERFGPEPDFESDSERPR